MRIVAVPNRLCDKEFSVDERDRVKLLRGHMRIVAVPNRLPVRDKEFRVDECDRVKLLRVHERRSLR